MVVVAGKASEDLRYLKSVALHLHLFGYELPGKCHEEILSFCSFHMIMPFDF